MAEQTAPGSVRKAPPCLSCKHYIITWDKALPYGCRVFNFKSATLPCRDVRGVSGLECLKYERKAVVKK